MFLLPTEDVTVDTDNFGNVLAARTFGTFYTVNETLVNANSVSAEQCVSYRNLLLNNVASTGSDYDVGTYCLNAYSTVQIEDSNDTGDQTYSTSYEAFIMDYNFPLQLIAGVAIVYLLFMYVIKVGVRVVQLTVLQMISPAAIVGYLSPKKDNFFTKWWKIYFATYIDVFIRTGIIYFVVYLSSMLLDTMDSGTNTFWNSVNPGSTSTRYTIVVVMILALLTFAKKAPELIKELMPSSVSKLGFGVSAKDIVGLNKGLSTAVGAGTGAAVGLLGGAAGGARAGYERNGILSGIGHGLTGALGGVTGGLFRGGQVGLGSKGVGSAMQTARKNQSQANKRSNDLVANGGTWLGSKVASAQEAIGMRNAADVDKANVDNINSYVKYQDELEGYAKNYSVVKRLERDYEAIKQGGRLRGESDEHYTTRIEVARQNWKRAIEATVNSSMTGKNESYYAAELQRNTTTGRWEVADSTSVTTLTNSDIPVNISGSISSKATEMNRAGRSLGYSAVSNYNDIDNNTNQARADVARITSQSSYARHQANTKK